MSERTCAVCGTPVARDRALRWSHDGGWYFFDDLDCRVRFVADPDRFTAVEPPRPA